MKIIQINAVYATGSTGHIVKDIHNFLISQGHEAYVFWGIVNKEKYGNKHFIRIGSTVDHKLHAIARRIRKDQGWHSRIATRMACKQIKKICPDIVHLHNLHSNYINLPILLDYLGKENIPVLVTLHDCWYLTGYCNHYYNFHNCLKWKNGCEKCPAISKLYYKKVHNMYMEKKRLFEKIERLAVNGVSQWTTEIVSQSILASSMITNCIYNWVDTQVFKPNENREKVCRKYDIPTDCKIILGVSQGWSERKGLREFVEISKKCEGKAIVVLVGEGSIPINKAIKKIGYVSERQELVDLYSAADIFVNPSRMETFGLVTVEAMACGTPVIAYDNTGSSELVPKECGVLVDDGNIGQLSNAVMEMICNSSKEKYFAACLSYAACRFDKAKNIGKYMALYEELHSVKESGGKSTDS